MAAKEAFGMFDSDHTGELDYKEMVQLLQALMPDQSKRQVRLRMKVEMGYQKGFTVPEARFSELLASIQTWLGLEGANASPPKRGLTSRRNGLSGSSSRRRQRLPSLAVLQAHRTSRRLSTTEQTDGQTDGQAGGPLAGRQTRRGSVGGAEVFRPSSLPIPNSLPAPTPFMHQKSTAAKMRYSLVETSAQPPLPACSSIASSPLPPSRATGRGSISLPLAADGSLLPRRQRTRSCVDSDAVASIEGPQTSRGIENGVFMASRKAGAKGAEPPITI